MFLHKSGSILRIVFLHSSASDIAQNSNHTHRRHTNDYMPLPCI